MKNSFFLHLRPLVDSDLDKNIYLSRSCTTFKLDTYGKPALEGENSEDSAIWKNLPFSVSIDNVKYYT